MNILTITAQKPDSTGSGIYLAETVRGFDALGHRVSVVCGVDAADNPQVPGAHALHRVDFNTVALPFSVAGMSDAMPYEATRYRDFTPQMTSQFKDAFSAAVQEAVRLAKPDLVICHHLYLVTALVAQMDLGCPVVAVCHSTDLRQMRAHPLERAFIRAGIQKLDGILALHDAQRAAIVELYGVDPARIAVVGTGFNDTVFYPVEGLRTPGLVRLAYAGKISRAKGVLSLLRALALLPTPTAEKPSRSGGETSMADCDPAGLLPFEVCLAGGHGVPEEYEAAERLARRCPHRVVFEGRLSQPELAELYNASDVFVLPSFYEGLPLVVVEALACGCKVVVTDLPGVRPWIESQMPGAPVVYVEPPRMVAADEPLPEDLPAFERRVAQAILEAVALPRPTPEEARSSTEHLSWTSLAERMLAAVCGLCPAMCTRR